MHRRREGGLQQPPTHSFSLILARWPAGWACTMIMMVVILMMVVIRMMVVMVVILMMVVMVMMQLADNHCSHLE